MCTHRDNVVGWRGLPATLIAVGMALGMSVSVAEEEHFGFGDEISEDELEPWDIDVRGSDGRWAPEGEGTVEQGREVYQQQCIACHGEEGQGEPADRLVGGVSSLSSEEPITTLGSYWPYAASAWDYIYRAMPFDAPQSLEYDEVYAVLAYLLHLNDILDEDATLSDDNLADIEMPNRDGFIDDQRPDWNPQPCWEECE